MPPSRHIPWQKLADSVGDVFVYSAKFHEDHQDRELRKSGRRAHDQEAHECLVEQLLAQFHQFDRQLCQVNRAPSRKFVCSCRAVWTVRCSVISMRSLLRYRAHLASACAALFFRIPCSPDWDIALPVADGNLPINGILYRQCNSAGAARGLHRAH